LEVFAKPVAMRTANEPLRGRWELESDHRRDRSDRNFIGVNSTVRADLPGGGSVTLMAVGE
jgi:hypothetical protein